MEAECYCLICSHLLHGAVTAISAVSHFEAVFVLFTVLLSG